MKNNILILCTIVLISFSVIVSAKIDPVLPWFKSESEIQSYIVGLPNFNIDTSTVNPTDKPSYVYRTLTAWTTKTQDSVKRRLDALGISYKSYWISNIIVVKSNMSIALELAQRSDIESLEPNNEFKVNLETPEYIEPENTSPNAVEWNLGWVKADEIWNSWGKKGEGFTIGNADTGIAWKHPALIGRYRGGQSGTVDHNYNWWDSVHDGGSNNCGLDSQEPCDDNGHGTHTTGTAVGFDPATSANIGVAPGATWIGCRNMNAGFGTVQRYVECLQFFAAPTDLSGKNPKPELAPHSIGNSYGCTSSEGCDTKSLEAAVKNVVAAGIFMSVSAGNEGPSCSTVAEPPAIYSESFSVGALARASHSIASYSSRGPVKADGSNRVKPNNVAPGSSVRSSYPPSGYASLSGTSMASPHVTGAIPLIWQIRPELLRKPQETAQRLEQTAVSYVTSTICGSGTDGADNIYGYGELDLVSTVSDV